MTIGEKIQNLRKQKGMSQKQLAEALGVSPQAVSRWELGESIPDVDNIVQLSKLFDVTTDYLLKNGEYKAEPMPRGEVVDDDDYDDDEDDDDGGLFTVNVNLNRIKGERGGFFSILLDNAYNIAVVVYLILGFGFGYWHPGWVVFIVAWAIQARSLYSFALIAFFGLGWAWGFWRWAWIVFPVAWLINSLIRDYRRRNRG